MKMKGLFLTLFLSTFVLSSCTAKKVDDAADGNATNVNDNGENDNGGNTEGGNGQGGDNEGGNGQGNQTVEDTLPDTYSTTIFLAGDSTVKTYDAQQYIGGWGQYLDLFLADNVVVKNCAEGGRSSRSFINEGRLYDRPNATYTFNQNGGNSIGDDIKVGDYLFIQFGHNDDSTKAANTAAERMVPLGTPDANGIYPTTPATETIITKNGSTIADSSVSSYVREAMSDSYESTLNTFIQNTLPKYGDSYYEYGNGTYKWYLKQYIDFAREKGATPVLVTPVARVKFSGSEIIGGPGLHGDNFAYVQAVRQLAQEEDCLLIDLFADSKEMLETATPTYANYVMALKPNSLVGEWPYGYDSSYQNTDKGYEGIEATHYNKYGAFIEAGYVAEAIKGSTEKKNSGLESFVFKSLVHENPEAYIDPSNLVPKATSASIESKITGVNVTNPNRTYNNFLDVVRLIAALPQVNEIDVNNYEEVGAACDAAREAYDRLNVDDRAKVANYSSLVDVQNKVIEVIISIKPVATQTIVLLADDLKLTVDSTITSAVTVGSFNVVGASGKAITIKSGASFKYNDETYSPSQSFSMGGAATFGSSRYIEFTTTKEATVTVVARSSGADTRTVKMVSSANTGTTVATFDAGASASITSKEKIAAGTYQLGSSASGMYIYAVIIEYFD